MNGDGNMTPFGSDGGRRTGVSPSPLIPVPPYPGWPDFCRGPWVSTQPLPHTSPSTSFPNSFMRPVHPTCSSYRSDSLLPRYSFNYGPRSVTQPAPMNGYGNMTPSRTRYHNPLCNDGGKRTGVSLSPLIPVPPYPHQVPTVTGYPVGSQHFIPGPRVSTQPLPTSSYLSHTSPSTSFRKPLRSVHPTCPSSSLDSVPLMNPFNYGPRSVTQPAQMNGYGNVTPSSTQYQNPLCNDGDKRTGVSPSPLISVNSPYPHVLTVTGYPAGSQNCSHGPRVSTQPLPTSSYLSHTSPSTSFRKPLRPVHPTCSSSGLDLFPLMNPLTSGPRSVTQPAPVFSSSQPLPVPSSFPPVAPKPRSVRRKSQPPKNPSPTAHVENTYSSIGSNQNPSPLPSQVPVTRSNSLSVSGSNTLPPRKSHKRTEDDIIGINSTTPLNPPESSYPPLSDMLVSDSTCDTEEDFEWLYDENAMKEFHDEYMIVDNTDNDANGNETVDSVMITIHNADGESSDSKKRFKTGPNTSGVKRIEGKGKGKVSSTSTDSSFNDMLKPSPSTRNLPVYGTENASSSNLGNGDYTDYELQEIARSTRLQEVVAEPKKVRRILSKRASAQRSKQRKMDYVAAMAVEANTLENEKALISRKITDLEKDNMTMTRENREMMIRVESLEREGQLRDEIEKRKASVVAQRLKEEIAVFEQLNAEFERLKVKLNHVQLDDGSNMQPLDQSMFQQLNTDQVIQPQPLDPTQQVNINQFIEEQPLEPNMFEQFDINQFNEQQPLEPNMFQQFDINQFHEQQPLEPNMFEQLDINQYTEKQPLEPNTFQQFDINQFNEQQQLEPNMFEQFDINQFNQSQALEPNMFEQFDINQFIQQQGNFDYYGQS